MDDELLYRCLTGRASGKELELVAAWRQASHKNEEHYRDLERLLAALASEEASRLSGSPPPVAAVIQRAQARMVSGVPRSHASGWPRRTKLALAAAAVAVAAISATLGSSLVLERHGGFGAEEIVTADRETSTVELLDGTVVRLGPNSRLQLMPDSGGRLVALDGRAYFAVASRRRDPFRIRTGAGEVTVTGTRFDLEAQGRDLRLIVVEGEVVLSSGSSRTEVAAGEMARILKGTAVPVVSVPEVGSLVRWVGNFMAFQATPLRDAAREIERQFGVSVEISDSILGDRTITAWFADWSLEDVMEVVCVVSSARCSIEGRVVSMRRRR